MTWQTGQQAADRVAWQQFESKGPAKTTEQIKTGLLKEGTVTDVVERGAERFCYSAAF